MSSVQNKVTTEKGTELPLLNLKGKPYLQAAHRLVWFAEQVPCYDISVEFLELTETRAVAKSTVTIFNDQNRIVRKVTDYKSETKSDFPDFVEKAATGATARCLASLGFGTAYALADLDEGHRIVDSPVNTVATNSLSVSTGSVSIINTTSGVGQTADSPAPRPSSFSKKKQQAVAQVTESNGGL